jgi:hypothetical protein
MELQALICSIPGCGRQCGPKSAKGLCTKHYSNLRRLGTPIYVAPTQSERFWAKVKKGGPGECWEWTAYRDPNGYGRFNIGGQGPIVLAHRFAYEELVGRIPDGLDLDHLCRNPPCVNPGHLEPVTAQINNLRGVGPAAKHAAKTHCPYGHEYTEDNIYWHKKPNGRKGRDCKTCIKERWAESHPR